MDFLKQDQNIIAIPLHSNEPFKTTITSLNIDSFCINLQNNILNPNENIDFIIQNEENVIKFKSYCISSQNNSATIKNTNEHKIIQRREHKRYNINLAVELKTIDSDNSFTSETINISGGGMKLKSINPAKNGELYQAKLTILNNKIVNTILEILRTEKINTNNYILSGQFKKISQNDRTMLVHLCTKRNLELKLKGIIKGDK